MVSVQTIDVVLYCLVTMVTVVRLPLSRMQKWRINGGVVYFFLLHRRVFLLRLDVQHWAFSSLRPLYCLNFLSSTSLLYAGVMVTVTGRCTRRTVTKSPCHYVGRWHCDSTQCNALADRSCVCCTLSLSRPPPPCLSQKGGQAKLMFLWEFWTELAIMSKAEGSAPERRGYTITRLNSSNELLKSKFLAARVCVFL